MNWFCRSQICSSAPPELQFSMTRYHLQCHLSSYHHPTFRENLWESQSEQIVCADIPTPNMILGFQTPPRLKKQNSHKAPYSLSLLIINHYFYYWRRRFRFCHPVQKISATNFILFNRDMHIHNFKWSIAGILFNHVSLCLTSLSTALLFYHFYHI